MTFWLSQYNQNSLCSTSNSLINFVSHKTFLKAYHVAMYYTLVADLTTIDWTNDFQQICSPTKVLAYHIVGLYHSCHRHSLYQHILQWKDYQFTAKHHSTICCIFQAPDNRLECFSIMFVRFWHKLLTYNLCEISSSADHNIY